MCRERRSGREKVGRFVDRLEGARIKERREKRSAVPEEKDGEVQTWSLAGSRSFILESNTQNCLLEHQPA